MKQENKKRSAWFSNLSMATVSAVALYVAGNALYAALARPIKLEWIAFSVLTTAVLTLAAACETRRHRADSAADSNRYAEQVAEMYAKMVKAMTAVIEAKDVLSPDRAARVQSYSVGLGRLCKLSAPEADALKAGSVLYDVGKLAVPDHILNKPASLTPAEFEKFKSHATIGAQMLEHVEFPYPVVPMVRHHHERWDGLGYPDGLAGKQIPLTARILAVVDRYVSEREQRRPNRAPASERAIEILMEGSGTIFDPEVVSVFLEHLGDLEAEMPRPGIEPSASRDAGFPVQTIDPVRAAFDNAGRRHEGKTLYQMSQMAGSGFDINDVFRAISAKLQDMVGYTTCVLYVQHDDAMEVEAVLASGRNADQFSGRRIALGAGISGWVAATRTPMYTGDPKKDFDELGLVLEEEYCAAAVIPLRRGEESLGALALYSAELPYYDAEHIRLGEALTNMSADAIAGALERERDERRALIDPLTGLASAKGFDRHFETEAAHARRFSELFAVLRIRVDGLDRVNDRLGRRAGDDVLRQMACVLSKHLRSDDALSRHGGDEFAATVRVDNDEARKLAERIQDAVAECGFGLVGSDLSVGVSIGWSVFPVDGEGKEELLLTAAFATRDDQPRRKALASASVARETAGGGPQRVM